MNYLVLLRHGQSQWNLENRFTGLHDVDITEQGVQEAENAGRQIAKAGIKFDQVYTSTLTRANRTTKIALEHAGQKELIETLVANDALRERDYGDLVGLNKDETRARYGEKQVQIWRRSYDTPPPGGECLKDVVEKHVGPYYEAHIKSKAMNEGQNILIGAHGNSLRAMLIILGVETPESINEAEIPTGKPLVLEIKNGKIQKRYFLGL